MKDKNQETDSEARDRLDSTARFFLAHLNNTHILAGSPMRTRGYPRHSTLVRMGTTVPFVERPDPDESTPGDKDPTRDSWYGPDENCLSFCSTNLYGLFDDPRLKASLAKSLSEYGYCNSSNPRMATGSHPVHDRLEFELSSFLHTEDAIVTASCFQANLAIFEGLLRKTDVIFSDERNHNSLIAGMRLSKAKVVTYRHLDMKHLEELLNQEESANASIRLIVSDGLFSIDAEYAPLPQISRLAKQYECSVILDDAHATFVSGKNGRGTLEHFQDEFPNSKDELKVDLSTGSLTKGLGCALGGFIAGRKSLLAQFRMTTNFFIYSTSTPVHDISVSLTALSLLKENFREWRRELREKSAYLRRAFSKNGFTMRGSDELATVPLLFDNDTDNHLFFLALLKRHVVTLPFTYPLAPKGNPLIRIQVTKAHTYKQLDHLIKACVDARKHLDFVTSPITGKLRKSKPSSCL